MLVKMIKETVKKNYDSRSSADIKIIDVEEFESTTEAVQFLGEAEALKLLNWAHNLYSRTRAHREMTRPKSKR
jgi:hypothetical protein